MESTEEVSPRSNKRKGVCSTAAKPPLPKKVLVSGDAKKRGRPTRTKTADVVDLTTSVAQEFSKVKNEIAEESNSINELTNGPNQYNSLNNFNSTDGTSIDNTIESRIPPPKKPTTARSKKTLSSQPSKPKSPTTGKTQTRAMTKKRKLTNDDTPDSRDNEVLEIERMLLDGEQS